MCLYPSLPFYQSTFNGDLMDRGIPFSASEEIELYQRTYYSLLRSSGEIQLKSLIETHAGMDSSLHVHAREHFPDMAAFVYSTIRLPDCIKSVRLVLLGQSEEVFEKAGFEDVQRWQEVSALGRRRKLYFDGSGTLAAFIASASDIDDLIPILTAFEIEWNKINYLLGQTGAMDRLLEYSERGTLLTAEERDGLANDLEISLADVTTLENIWGNALISNLLVIGSARKHFALRLLAGSFVDYHKATQRWWKNIAHYAGPVIRNRPVYFVSSNTHSLVNLVSGYALEHEQDLIDFIGEIQHQDLMREYQAIQAEEVKSSKENFLYYVLKKYLADAENTAAVCEKDRAEAEVGITYVKSDRYLDVDAQIIELNKLVP